LTILERGRIDRAFGSRFVSRLLLGSLIFIAIVDVYSTAQVLLGGVWVCHWLWVSPSAFSSVFLGVALLLKRRGGVRDGEIFIVALLTMISMIWMYELFYHLGFWASEGFPTLAGWEYEVIASDLLWMSTAIVGLKYMRASIPFIGFFSSFVGLYALWVATGYQQIALYSIAVAPGSGIVLLQMNSSLLQWVIGANEATKYLLAASYVSLFVPKRAA
jgi:hypothetical protein